MNQEDIDNNRKLERLMPEGGMKFRCSKCGLERWGNDKKECEHLYMDYNEIIK